MEIINIGGLVINNYIIKTLKGCVVIDTGYPNGFDSFKKKLDSIGIAAEDIRFIFLTHAHDDHAGYLNELLAYTNASLILHKDAVERLKIGQNYFTGGCSSRQAQLFCKMMALAGKAEHKFPSVDMIDRFIPVDGTSQPLRDSGIPGTILMLSGHTADSIGLLLDDGSMFCGDAAMNGFPSKARHTIWIENAQDFKKSWEVMLEGKPVKIYPSHGKPFSPSDLLKYKEFLNGKKLYQL